MPNSVPLLPFTSECTLAHNINIFCRIFFWLQFREIFIRKQQRKRLFLRILSSLLFVSLPSPSVRSLTALAFLALDQSLDSAYNALRVSFGLSDSVCSPISGVALAIQWQSNGNPMATQWQSNGNPMAIHWQWTALRSNIIIPGLPSTLNCAPLASRNLRSHTCTSHPSVWGNDCLWLLCVGLNSKVIKNTLRDSKWKSIANITVGRSGTAYALHWSSKWYLSSSNWFTCALHLFEPTQPPQPTHTAQANTKTRSSMDNYCLNGLSGSAQPLCLKWPCRCCRSLRSRSPRSVNISPDINLNKHCKQIQNIQTLETLVMRTTLATTLLAFGWGHKRLRCPISLLTVCPITIIGDVRSFHQLPGYESLVFMAREQGGLFCIRFQTKKLPKHIKFYKVVVFSMEYNPLFGRKSKSCDHWMWFPS